MFEHVVRNTVVTFAFSSLEFVHGLLKFIGREDAAAVGFFSSVCAGAVLITFAFAKTLVDFVFLQDFNFADFLVFSYKAGCFSFVRAKLSVPMR